MKYIINLIDGKEKEYFVHVAPNGTSLVSTNIKCAKRFDTETEAHEYIKKYYNWTESKIYTISSIDE